MNHFFRLGLAIWLSLGSLAAADAASEYILSRFNCVIEKNGSMACHEGHEATPCVCYFDARAAKEKAIHIAVAEGLKTLAILKDDSASVSLSLYGIGRDGTIHRGWDKITAEQVDAFWNSLSERGYTDNDKNLGNIPMTFSRLANYVIKVSYATID